MTYSIIGKQNPLILASASPRRKRLLEQAGLPFRSITSQVAEEGVFGNPEHDVCLLAEKKAREVYPRVGESWVLGADTIVVVDGTGSNSPEQETNAAQKVLGKPENATEAGHMLRLLSGKEHKVITGICILDPSGETAHSEAIVTSVCIKKLTDQEWKALPKSVRENLSSVELDVELGDGYYSYVKTTYYKVLDKKMKKTIGYLESSTLSYTEASHPDEEEGEYVIRYDAKGQRVSEVGDYQ